MNPLLEKFNTPFQTVPFDKIKNEHYLPAIKTLIKNAKEAINIIANSNDPITFENIALPLEKASLKPSQVSSIFFNLNLAETNDEMQRIAKEFSPLLTEFMNDILLNEKLFHRYKALWEKQETFNLNTEQKTLIDKTYKSFIRNGALLNETDKTKLREIDKKLSRLSLDFGEHVLKETNNYELHITNEKDLQGLPDSIIEAAKEEAKARGKNSGWVFTLQYPSYIPFETYADNRSLREQLFRAFSSKACKNNENDNQGIIREIINLRHERAKILGYPSHASFVLEERMAKTPEKVFAFLEELLSYSKTAGKKDIQETQTYMERNGAKFQLERWDYAYYSEKLKKEKFNIDDETLRPYFKLDNAISGIFKVANKLYGLNFKANNEIPTYHPEVQAYEVTNGQNKHMGILYMDFFPRAGKRTGAWMTAFREQNRLDNHDTRPHVSIVCNFTKPTDTRPSLLTFSEVQTLFHEFGHSLHNLLSECTYESLSGPNVYWDFVELPSQIMENWILEKECLDLFAFHYETGEKLPEEYVEKIKLSSNFHEGRATLRQLGFALLDMTWHELCRNKDMSKVNIFALEKEALSKIELFPPLDDINISCSFSHIFQGGYSAGYYSYKWAEVLDADAFEYFKENGIFNKEIANKFRNCILARGGSEHPEKLYKCFRGREPSVKALLRRGGLL